MPYNKSGEKSANKINKYLKSRDLKRKRKKYK